MTKLAPGTPGFVERLLADRIGLDVASVGSGLIVRGVEIRMAQLGVRRLEDYERILLGPTDEIQALIEEVVIPESWFFRDDRPFATFREFVRAHWVNDSRRAPISVLCLPCAGGEEPYSVVIALWELGLARERFQVVAIDISERSIQRAIAGFFSSNAFRGMDPKLQTLYFDFTAVRGRYQLKPSIRSAVQFKEGNLLDPTLLNQHPGFDVVFCRNLLIYFDEPARIKAFSNLDRLTAEGGLLFLGHADRPDPNASTRFVQIGDKGSFVYRKEKDGSTSAPPPSLRPPALKIPRPVSWAKDQILRAVPRRPVDPARPLGVAPSEVPAPRAVPPNPVASNRSERDEAMLQASVLADQGRYAEATRLVLELTARGPLDASAHFLLGIIHQAAGERVKAESELTKAIYLNPDHDEALLALALLARRKGDMATEAMFRRRADRVLARKGS